MTTIEVKKVSVNDLEKLQIIGKQTFYETFSAGKTENDMQKYLKESFSIQKLTKELNDVNTQIYFALKDDEIIGYLKLNFRESQTELQDSESLEVERIYVLKAYYGKQVGQILYNKALAVAKTKGVGYIWLGVWEKNPRALSFYKKNGFLEFDKHIFKLGDDHQTDIMMKVILKK